MANMPNQINPQVAQAYEALNILQDRLLNLQQNDPNRNNLIVYMQRILEMIGAPQQPQQPVAPLQNRIRELEVQVNNLQQQSFFQQQQQDLQIQNLNAQILQMQHAQPIPVQVAPAAEAPAAPPSEDLVAQYNAANPPEEPHAEEEPPAQDLAAQLQGAQLAHVAPPAAAPKKKTAKDVGATMGFQVDQNQLGVGRLRRVAQPLPAQLAPIPDDEKQPLTPQQMRARLEALEKAKKEDQAKRKPKK
jgi:hypothetical protein